MNRLSIKERLQILGIRALVYVGLPVVCVLLLVLLVAIPMGLRALIIAAGITIAGWVAP